VASADGTGSSKQTGRLCANSIWTVPSGLRRARLTECDAECSSQSDEIRPAKGNGGNRGLVEQEARTSRSGRCGGCAYRQKKPHGLANICTALQCSRLVAVPDRTRGAPCHSPSEKHKEEDNKENNEEGQAIRRIQEA